MRNMQDLPRRLELTQRRHALLEQAQALHQDAEAAAHCQATHDALSEQALALEQQAEDLTAEDPCQHPDCGRTDHDGLMDAYSMGDGRGGHLCVCESCYPKAACSVCGNSVYDLDIKYPDGDTTNPACCPECLAAAERGVLTVGDVRRQLARYPDDTPIHVGICDDSYNAAGGLFPRAEVLSPSRDDWREGDAVQLTAWVDIKQG